MVPVETVTGSNYWTKQRCLFTMLASLQDTTYNVVKISLPFMFVFTQKQDSWISARGQKEYTLRRTLLLVSYRE
jgi:hypothetical protein